MPFLFGLGLLIPCLLVSLGLHFGLYSYIDKAAVSTNTPFEVEFQGKESGVEGGEEKGHIGRKGGEVLPPSDVDNKKTAKKDNDSGGLDSDGGCGRSPYGGIGVRGYFAGQLWLVTEVFPDYPAALSGIQVGDYIYNIGGIIGEPGTLVEVKINRNGQIFTIEIERDLICYN